MALGSDDLSRMMRYASVFGPVFGSEDSSLLLHSLVKMQQPEVVVELGTGLGVSAVAMAFAAKANGRGMVFTVDDLEFLERDPQLLGCVIEALTRNSLGSFAAANAAEFFDELIREFGLSDHLTVVRTTIDLDDPHHIDSYPFAELKIGLLFSDFSHGPDDILGLLAHFLPRMTPFSSLIVDSVPSDPISYLTFERLIQQLQTGRILPALAQRCTVDLHEVIRARRLTLVHFLERKDRASQNGCSLLRLEPRTAATRGTFDDA